MIQRPSLEQLDRIARAYGLGLGPEDLIEFRNLVSAALASYDRVHDMVEPKPPVTYSRSVGYRPGEEENPLGAWYWKTKVPGASEGKLSGKRIVLKDNVSLAGVPMMNGTSVLEGYVPDVDATIVTRILDAGGEIVGKAVCEHLCFSGSSFTSDTGPVRNPHDPSRSAGGRPAEVPYLWPPGTWTWPLVATRGDRFGSPVPGAGCMG